MDADKMQSIKQHYLINYEKNMKVKQIDSNNELKCNSKQELDDKRTIGYYLSKNRRNFGVFRHQNTLYFMIDQNYYDVKQMNLVFECKNKDFYLRTFAVKSNEESLIEIIYDRVIEIEDNWSSEDDLDFFAWITNIYEKGRLDNILRY
jgi:hypothetical protein